MEAVYTLMNVDRAVPEVWGYQYDVRELLKACYYAVDKKTIDELPLNLKEKFAIDTLLKMIRNTDVEQLIKDSGLLKQSKQIKGPYMLTLCKFYGPLLIKFFN